MIFLTLSFLLYFAPALLATSRQSPNATAIWLTNLFVGWTVIGWVVTLVWAMHTPVVGGVGPAAGFPAAAPFAGTVYPAQSAGGAGAAGWPGVTPTYDVAGDGARTCVGCSRPLPADARFCPACGSVESRLG